MIKYSLVCEHEHEFEGWFANSAAFDKLAAQKQLECPDCGSHKVSKGIMAPNIAKTGRSRSQSEAGQALQMQAYMRQMASQFRAHVEKNFDNVGKEFPEEARKMHYGEADERPIYGEATVKEAKELVDEGVEICPIPDVPKVQ